MALIVNWYDFICFIIALAAIVASLWIVLRRERGCMDVEVTAHSSSSLLLYTSKSHRSWTSCWLRLHPGWLLFTRSFSFLSMAALLAWDIYMWDTSIFVYYTEWTFILVMIYFAMGTGASVYGCFGYSKELTLETGEDFVLTQKVGDELLRQRLQFLDSLTEIVFQTSAGAVVLTDSMFWLVIVPFLSNTHLGLNTLMICMHTANLGFLLLETALNSLSFPWFRMGYFVLWSCLYVVFQWIIHACGFTWWPYPFLELDKPLAPLWYLCMAILHIPCYGAYAALVKAKNTCFTYLFPNSFVIHRSIMQ